MSDYTMSKTDLFYSIAEDIEAIGAPTRVRVGDAMHDADYIGAMRVGDSCYLHVTKYGSHIFQTFEQVSDFEDISGRHDAILYAIERRTPTEYAVLVTGN